MGIMSYFSASLLMVFAFGFILIMALPSIFGNKKSLCPLTKGQKLIASAIPPKLPVSKKYRSLILCTNIHTPLITDRVPVGHYFRLSDFFPPSQVHSEQQHCRFTPTSDSLKVICYAYSSCSTVSIFANCSTCIFFCQVFHSIIFSYI